MFRYGINKKLTITATIFSLAFFSVLAEEVLAAIYYVDGSKLDDSGLATSWLTAKKAIPYRRYEFSGWTGDYTGTENPLILENVESDMNIQAVFNYVGPDFPWVLFYPSIIRQQ